MDGLTLLLIFTVATIASFYGTLIGGTSLLTIPLLINLGLPPQAAIATNRAGLLGLPIAGWYKFHKQRAVRYPVAWLVALSSIAGTFIGANLVLSVDEAILERIIAIVTLVMLAIILARPNAGLEELKRTFHKRHYVAGGIICFLIGIYAGFYGAGAGTFYGYLLILLFGQTFIEAAATRKIAALLNGLVATAVFLYHGIVIFTLAAVIFPATFLGSYLGAHYAGRIGNRWIKIGFAVLVTILSLRLLL